MRLILRFWRRTLKSRTLIPLLEYLMLSVKIDAMSKI